MRLDPTLETSEVQDGPRADESARKFLALIDQAEEEFAEWNEVCDNIDDVYGKLGELATGGADRQFKLFWANLEVLRPMVYSRPPVPVVGPRFPDRKPLPRKSAEVLERALITVTAETNLHETLKLVRDDLARLARGVVWVRMDGDDLCFDFVHRQDFLHDPRRNWSEVEWVARKAYLSRERVEKLFPDADMEALGFHKFDAIDQIKGFQQAEVWEMWHKAENAVLWLAQGHEKPLKRTKPPVDLDGFYPCPQPVYGTVQPGSLIPIPDMVYYRDQLDEINSLTARIGALTQALKVQGFYDSAAEGGTASAIERAVKSNTDNAILIPVPGLSKLTNNGGKLIEWLPIDMVAQTVQGLVALRQQLITDVYEISGLSDIMRGSTMASETATAQNLKSQYGNVRVRERQEAMINVARDLYRIAGEMLAERVSGQALLDMAQVDDLPKKADLRKQMDGMIKQAEQAKAAAEAQMQALQQQATEMDAQAQAMMQQAQMAEAQGQEIDPDQAEAMQAQYQQARGQIDEQMQGIQQQVEQGGQALQEQIAEIEGTLTFEAVTGFLKDEKLRPFALSIETDSTIAGNEDAEKARRMEFMAAFGGLMQQLAPLVMQMPQAGAMAAAMLKFGAGAFRAGRELEQPIDDFAEQIEAMAGQQSEDPNAAAMQQQQAAQMMEQQLKQAEARRDDATAKAEIALTQAKTAETAAKTRQVEEQLRMVGMDRAAERVAEAQADHIARFGGMAQ